MRFNLDSTKATYFMMQYMISLFLKLYESVLYNGYIKKMEVMYNGHQGTN